MEFELIERLKSALPHDSQLPLGIGDDCAILADDAGYEQLVTTDMLLDGVHFIYDTDKENAQSLELIARKSIAVSLSDIAAMGGEPQTAFLSLAIPRSWTASQANELFDSFAHAASEFQITVAGGDTTSWNHLLAINVTLIGRVPKSEAIRRSGAQAGDFICVSGPLGSSLSGKHLAFMPRVQQGQWLREHCAIHAMIDISDGLLADLGHILQQSKVGAEIFTTQIPISKQAGEISDNKSPLEHALTDGEDFELLWTMPKSECKKLMLQKEDFIDVYHIGNTTKEKGCFLVDQQGHKERRSDEGYVHQLGEE